MFEVKIVEKLVRKIKIEAYDEYTACNEVYDLWRLGDIVLNSDDYIGEPEITVIELPDAKS